jgi:hypothetical protein
MKVWCSKVNQVEAFTGEERTKTKCPSCGRIIGIVKDGNVHYMPKHKIRKGS